MTSWIEIATLGTEWLGSEWGTRAVAFLFTHAVTALALALIVALLVRPVRQAAIVHTLWVVVLLKLWTPPLIELPILPASASEPAGLGTRMSIAGAAPSPSAVRTPPPATLSDPTRARDAKAELPLAELLARGLLGLLGAGSVWVSCLAVFRLRSFARLLRRARPAPDRRLQDRVAELAPRLALERLPEVRVVPARISPMIWPRLGGAELLLPRDLCHRLEGPELDAVLLHELAHLKRKDHWVRLLELSTAALFWWHPAVWWARRRLRRAEERSCDVLVAHALPGRARDYAEGLIRTLEFLTSVDRPLPAVGTGLGLFPRNSAKQEQDDMKERLIMILKERPHLLAPWQRWLLAAGALALLAVVPSLADRARTEEDIKARESHFREAAIELEKRETELRRELRELEVARRELHFEREELVRNAKLSELESKALELDSRGHTQEAELHRLKREAIVKERELARETYELERRMMDEVLPLEIELHERKIEIEELQLRGEKEQAEALEAKLRQREKELSQIAKEHKLRQQDLLEVELAHRREALANRRQVLLDAGREEDVRRLEKELVYLENQSKKVTRRRQLQNDREETERYMAEVRAKVEALEASGDMASARDLRLKLKAKVEARELAEQAVELRFRDAEGALIRAELKARLAYLEAKLAEALPENRSLLEDDLEMLKKELAELSKRAY